MKARSILLTLALAGVVALLAGPAVAHEIERGYRWFDRDEVTTEVKEVEDGIEVTITSENEEIAGKLKEEASWYEQFFSRGCGHWGARGPRHGRRGHWGHGYYGHHGW